jgi:hypothetical protein
LLFSNVEGVLCTWLTFDAGMGFFTALSLVNCYTYMNQVYWSQPILSFIAYPILLFLSSRNRPPRKEGGDKTKKDA